MDNIVIDLNKLEEKIKVIEDRLKEAFTLIEDEQERLTVIINSLCIEKLLSKDYILHTLLSSKMSIECIRSILKDEDPNFKFEGLEIQQKLKKSEHEEAYEENSKGFVKDRWKWENM